MYVCWSPSSECMNFGKSGKVEKFGSFFFLVKLGDEIRLHRQLILSNKTTLPKNYYVSNAIRDFINYSFFTVICPQNSDHSLVQSNV